jgi:hypothetical protein
MPIQQERRGGDRISYIQVCQYAVALSCLTPAEMNRCVDRSPFPLASGNSLQPDHLTSRSGRNDMIIEIQVRCGKVKKSGTIIGARGSDALDSFSSYLALGFRSFS